MSTCEIQNWSDLSNLLDRSGCVFRGHPGAYGDLRSSFARTLADPATKEVTQSVYQATDIEGDAIQRFAAAAHQFLRPQEVPELRTLEMQALTLEERLPWLALMQHYGAPTRLLDWTESPLVAAYFAVEKNWERDGELWACNLDSLRLAVATKLGTDQPGEPFNESPLVQWIDKDTKRQPLGMDWSEVRGLVGFEPGMALKIVCKLRQIQVDLLLADRPDLESIVFPITVGVMTDRMHAQQGWFTVPLDPRTDHLHCQSLSGVAIERIAIPASAKPDLLRKLTVANIGGHALFPGLDGLGRSIAERIRLK